ncbi:alginate export family protein [Catalinimonas niigatensis]|uniref:alginate export family protein n=1 Tax=Catalinimonas niigatensis TaxID=1397264 RepID=UPI002666E0FB|nr:alginate export family protein [Catalinimonas niigatensis]WPP50604.1 alginate export family protein [Catalinimonas niigatensis]
MRFTLLTLSFFSSLVSAFAQFTFGGEIRPRFEYRHGAHDIPSSDDKAAIHISQRSRLNVAYAFDEKWEAYLSIQDVRVWGEQGDRGDASTFNLYQGWVQGNLAKKWQFKLGRQELSYDDGYLFNPRNWGQPGRTHDVGLIKFTDSTFQLHLLAGHSQNRADNFNTFYDQQDYYKNLQMLWMHKEIANQWKASFVAVNRGLQRTDSTLAYDHTMGGNLAFKQSKYSFRIQAYGQFGDGLEIDRKSAYLWSAQAAYYLSRNLQISLKTDIVSGTDTQTTQDPLAQETNTFDVLYGYRHKYYGHMDYFYLSFAPSTGLEDLVFGLKYKPVPRLTTTVDLHSFYAQASLTSPTDVQEPVDSHLGEELDIAFEYQAYEHVKVQGGYSQMFATPSMEVLRGHGNHKETANWIWLQASFILKQ